MRQCDDVGFQHNCLVPLRHSLEAPGGPLKYSLDGHNFAVFGCSLTSDQRYVISTSTRFISWDLATSEVCRDIDPQAQGIMLGMAISKDNRFVVSFTSSYQLIILDIMLGHFVRVEKPMEDGEPIVDVCFTEDAAVDAKAVVFNSKCFRMFNKKGEHVAGGTFSVSLPDVLSMRFFDDKINISLHWTGDQDLEDARLWLVHSATVGGERSEPRLFYHCLEVVGLVHG